MKKKIIYVIAGIIIVIILISIILFIIDQSGENTIEQGEILSELVIKTQNNGSYAVGDYAYAYVAKGEQEEHIIECIDYYGTGEITTITLSEPEIRKIETGNQIELWSFSSINLNVRDEIVCLFLHSVSEKMKDGSWKTNLAEYWLYFYDKSGNVLNKMLLDEAFCRDVEEKGNYINTIFEGKDGTLYALSLFNGEQQQTLYKLDSEGIMIETRVFDSYTILYKTASGYTILRSDNTIEILEEDCPYQDAVAKMDVDFVYAAYPGEEYEFTFWTDGIFYGVNTEGKKEQIFAYESSNPFSSLESDSIYRDGILYGIKSGLESDTIIKITEDTNSASDNDREVIYIASVYGLSESELFIRDFNMENTEYRIEILPYYEESDPQKALAEDILTGKEIDIVDLSGMDYESLIEKGMLADIYEFIDEDPDMDISDFDEDILQAYERDGKLYEIVPAYYIGTMVTNGQKVNGYGGWSYDTMCQLAGAQPDRCSNYELFMYGMMSNMEQVYDKQNNSCDFDGEWFSDLLTNSSKLPSYNDVVAYSVLEQVEVRGFADCSLSVNDICFLSAYNENQSNEIAISGLPGIGGDFHYLQAAQMFAITSTSDKQEIAWEVCRELLTREYQLSLCSGSGAFATRTDAMDELYEMITATTAYNHEVLGYIEPYNSNIAFGTPMENLTWGPADEEYIDIIEECKENCRVQTYEEIMITNMVWEEAEPYFAENGSVQDTKDKIQNRVSIYLWE